MLAFQTLIFKANNSNKTIFIGYVQLILNEVVHLRTKYPTHKKAKSHANEVQYFQWNQDHWLSSTWQEKSDNRRNMLLQTESHGLVNQLYL